MEGALTLLEIVPPVSALLSILDQYDVVLRFPCLTGDFRCLLAG